MSHHYNHHVHRSTYDPYHHLLPCRHGQQARGLYLKNTSILISLIHKRNWNFTVFSKRTFTYQDHLCTFFLHYTLEYQFSEQVWHSSPHISLLLACPPHWECSWMDPHTFRKVEQFFVELKFILYLGSFQLLHSKQSILCPAKCLHIHNLFNTKKIIVWFFMFEYHLMKKLSLWVMKL